MKKTLVFLRHAGKNKEAIRNCMAQIPFYAYAGKSVKILASNQAEADPTVRELESRLKTVAFRTPYLAGAPCPQDSGKVIQVADMRTEHAEVVFVVTHADHAARLPNAFGSHYELASCPSIRERKPGAMVAMKVPGAKVKNLINQTLSAAMAEA